MGWIIALANLKGGTGKSTLAVNIACQLAVEHESVHLVDADTQGTSAAWLEGGAEGRPSGLTVEHAPVGDDSAAWADRIYQAAASHERVVIDMPPQLGPGFEAALRVVDALLVPVTPSAIDLRATARTLQRIEVVRRQRDNRPACILVPNRIDQRTAVGRSIQRALRDLDWAVAPPVAQRASQAAAFAARQWIGAHAPGSPALREVAAVAAVLEKTLAGCAPSDYRLGSLAPQTLPPPSVQNGMSRPAQNPEATQRTGFFASLLNGIRLIARPHGS